jgi:hypothetical protein
MPFYAGKLRLWREIVAPVSHHRSLLALGMCFPPVKTGADVQQNTATCCAFCSNIKIFGAPQVDTLLNNKCYATVGCNIRYCNSSSVSQNQPTDVENVHIMYSCWLNMSI